MLPNVLEKDLLFSVCRFIMHFLLRCAVRSLTLCHMLYKSQSLLPPPPPLERGWGWGEVGVGGGDGWGGGWALYGDDLVSVITIIVSIDVTIVVDNHETGISWMSLFGQS